MVAKVLERLEERGKERCPEVRRLLGRSPRAIICC